MCTCIALAIGSFWVSVTAIMLSRGAGEISAVWPVNAILLIIVLKWPRDRWPALFTCLMLGNFAANIVSGDGVLRGLLLTTANGLETFIAAWILVGKAKSSPVRDLAMGRLFIAALTACAASTSIALPALFVTGDPVAIQDAALWFLADLLGMLLFAPLIWALFPRRYGAVQNVGRYSVLEAVLVVVVTCAVFAQSNYPLLFLVPAVLVPITFRHGVRGAAYSLLTVSIISVVLTYLSMGPTMLIQGDLTTRMLVLQAFLVANSFMALSLGASVSASRRLNTLLRKSKKLLGRRYAREKILLQQAEMAQEISQVGHWTLIPGTGQVYWSSEVYRIHGVSPDTFDPTYDEALGFYEEEDRERLATLAATHIETGGGWNVEASLVRRSDGMVRRVRSIARCHVGASGKVEKVFGVFKDITDEHVLYAALAAKEEQYRLLAEHATDIVLKLNSEGVITYASPSAEVILSPELLIGRYAIDFVVPEDRRRSTANARELFEGRPPTRDENREFRVNLADGSVAWFEGKPQLICDDQGVPVEVVSAFRDVSERHDREQALAEARLAAETAAVARTEFLSNMSHEIRTPLNGVLGFTEVLQSTDLTQDQETCVQRISSAGGTLLGIVDDILDFSKIDAGRMEVEQCAFDIRAVVDETVSLVSVARPNTEVAISHHVSDYIADAVLGDEIRVKQILMNIIGNAAKFTDTGSVTVDARLENGQIHISVMDTGPGIPKGKLEHVFIGFSQADSSITRQYGGSGLGLSISRSLARLMGGDLSLASRQGEGTTVTLVLPYHPAQKAPLEEFTDPQLDEALSFSARIMIVDDVEMNRALLETGLGKAGLETVSFCSAPEAILSLLEDAPYDVILMDVQMPDMDGLTAARHIREMPGPVGQTPIIALTANVLSSQVQACRDAGMEEHVGKPVNIKRLVKLIERVVSARHAKEGRIYAPGA